MRAIFDRWPGSNSALAEAVPDEHALHSFLALISHLNSDLAWTLPLEELSSYTNSNPQCIAKVRAFYDHHPSYFCPDDVVRLLFDLKFAVKRQYISRAIGGRFFPASVDLGCGIGDCLPLLSAHSALAIGIDVSQRALAIAPYVLNLKHSRAHLMAADAARLPLRTGSMDLIVCSELLEHLYDDTVCLVEILRVLRRGGVLIGTVPSGSRLSDADLFWGHFRRYEMTALCSLLVKRGFSIDTLGSFGFPMERIVWPRLRRLFSHLANSRRKDRLPDAYSNESALLCSSLYLNRLSGLVDLAVHVDRAFGRYRGPRTIIFEATKR